MSSSGDYPKHNVIMQKEGLDKVCTWTREKGISGAECPHFIDRIKPCDKKIKDSIIDCIGNTPLVRINNITAEEGIKCEVLAKCEFLNPSGSVKDRTALHMINDSVRKGLLKKGGILLEPTSGNTGISLAMIAAVRGYKTVIAMQERMTGEKPAVLKAFGAEIIRTPNGLPYDHIESTWGTAQVLGEMLPTAVTHDQYSHHQNPIAHYATTAQEIYDQCEGRLDYVVLGSGTGGTITGIARRMKELDPNIQVVGVDPVGSIVAQPEELNRPGGPTKIEGMGHDFIPRALGRESVDRWIKAEDPPTMEYARKLISKEGFMCGASSGAAMCAAMQIARDLPEGKRVVVVLADNIRNYITKFISTDWMFENGFLTEEQWSEMNAPKLIPSKDWGQNFTVGDLDLKEAHFLTLDATAGEAINLMKQTNFDQFPVKGADGSVVGILDARTLAEKLIKNKLTVSDKIAPSINKSYRKVTSNLKLHDLQKIFDNRSFVLVDGCKVASIQDLLSFINEKQA